MHKLLAAALLLVPLAMIGGAQEKPDRPVMQIGGTMEDIPIAEMVQVTAEYQKLRFLYNSKSFSGAVNVTAPEGGIKIASSEMLPVLQDSLAQFGLCAVESGDVRLVVPRWEVASHAPVVKRDELTKLSGDFFVAALITIEHADPKAVRNSLQNLTSRIGGSVHILGNSVLICDRCARVRELLKLVDEMEDNAKLITRRYQLPPGADKGEWSRSFIYLFGLREDSPCLVVTAPTGEAVIITTNEATHAEVADAIEALK